MHTRPMSVRFTNYMTSSTSVGINLARREMVILGSEYAGEMKKGIFSVCPLVLFVLVFIVVVVGCPRMHIFCM